MPTTVSKEMRAIIDELNKLPASQRTEILLSAMEKQGAYARQSMFISVRASVAVALLGGWHG